MFFVGADAKDAFFLTKGQTTNRGIQSHKPAYSLSATNFQRLLFERQQRIGGGQYYEKICEMFQAEAEPAGTPLTDPGVGRGNASAIRIPPLESRPGLRKLPTKKDRRRVTTSSATDACARSKKPERFVCLAYQLAHHVPFGTNNLNYIN
jgi:hypothetical protein